MYFVFNLRSKKKNNDVKNLSFWNDIREFPEEKRNKLKQIHYRPLININPGYGAQETISKFIVKLFMSTGMKKKLLQIQLEFIPGLSLIEQTLESVL